MSTLQDMVIRAAEPDDYEDVAALFSGPAAQGGTLQLPFPSYERWRRRLENPADDTYQLVATVEDNVIGMVGLHLNTGRRRHSASIGMAVHDDYQGRGVGTALLKAAINLAERWLGLTRLELNVYPDNEAAIKLYKRHGFVVEGTLRRYALRDGRYVDALQMARVRDLQPSGE